MKIMALMEVMTDDNSYCCYKGGRFIGNVHALRKIQRYVASAEGHSVSIRQETHSVYHQTDSADKRDPLKR